MVYSNEELTQHVKELESIILDFMYQASRQAPYIRSICVNTSLHSPHMHREEVDAIEHPVDLLVPHYTWQPKINWRRDQIYLHPGNEPRA